MKAILVDDEQNAIESLKTLLDLYGKQVEVIGYARTIDDAIKLITTSSFDILFLDIELQEGLGIEILEHFPNRKFKTVFVTAYDHYAIQAFRLHAFDYLLKPIDPDDLIDLFKRLEQKPTSLNRSVASNQPKSRITVPTLHGSRFIELSEIIRLQSDNTYTKIILENEKPVLVTKTLKKFEDSICQNSFIRVHRSHIVNFTKVKEYTKQDGGFLILYNGDEVPISKANKAFIDKAIEFRMINV